MPPALAELLDAPAGSKRVDLGGGVQAVREHDRLWLESGPLDLDGPVVFGGWRIESTVPGLKVRGWRAGDRLAGRTKKVQDVFVDAKVPRSDREGWPLVVRGDEVVAVPGIVEAEGVTAARVAD
jgi:tRNA(Ile)-lysidine synthetase-like protein